MSKLLKAPLKEVIFEVRWKLTPDQTGTWLVDEGYDLAVGKFQNLVENDFPFVVRKLPQNLPGQLLSFLIDFQFWRDENRYPVVQIGRGIMTVNDTDHNYLWAENYRPAVIDALIKLQKAYGDLEFEHASLRYLDAVQLIDYNFNGWPDFISNHLNIGVNNSFEVAGKPTNVAINQTFKLDNGSDLNVQVSDTVHDNKPGMLWQTMVSRNDTCGVDELLTWLDEAHETTSKTFRSICKPEFYDSFI